MAPRSQTAELQETAPARAASAGSVGRVALHQPRAELAGVQPARARPGAATRRIRCSSGSSSSRIAGTQPRRVLHGPRRDAAQEAAAPASTTSSPDGLTHGAAARRDPRTRARADARRSGRLLERAAAPAAGGRGHPLPRAGRLHAGDATRTWRSYFKREICPVLTPLAFDPGHPFPFISNLSMNFAVRRAAQRPHEVRAREGAGHAAALHPAAGDAVAASGHGVRVPRRRHPRATSRSCSPARRSKARTCSASSATPTW